jgi:fructose-1,6-bisphosphatase I
VAGYFVYGPATMLVYTAGPKAGVQGFTLDPGIGEFLLSHPDIRIPRRGSYYACNEGFVSSWPEGPRKFVEALRSSDPAKARPYSTRYSGALVVDFHRILLRGGVFLYPGTDDSPEGKLRLMYEAAPLAAVAEAAGGMAIDGRRRIVSVFPEENHQRTPLYIGSREDVEELERTIAGASVG